MLAGWREVPPKRLPVSATTVLFATVLCSIILEVHSVAAAKVEKGSEGRDPEGQETSNQETSTDEALKYGKGLQEIEVAQGKTTELTQNLEAEALPKKADEAVQAGEDYKKSVETLDNGEQALQEGTTGFRKGLADSHKGQVGKAETALSSETVQSDSENTDQESTETTKEPEMLIEVETTETRPHDDLRQTKPVVLAAPRARARQKADGAAAVGCVRSGCSARCEQRGVACRHSEAAGCWPGPCDLVHASPAFGMRSGLQAGSASPSSGHRVHGHICTNRAPHLCPDHCADVRSDLRAVVRPDLAAVWLAVPLDPFPHIQPYRRSHLRTQPDPLLRTHLPSVQRPHIQTVERPDD